MVEKNTSNYKTEAIAQKRGNKPWMTVTVMGEQLEQKSYKMPMPKESRKPGRERVYDKNNFLGKHDLPK